MCTYIQSSVYHGFCTAAHVGGRVRIWNDPLRTALPTCTVQRHLSSLQKEPGNQREASTTTKGKTNPFTRPSPGTFATLLET